MFSLRILVLSYRILSKILHKIKILLPIHINLNDYIDCILRSWLNWILLAPFDIIASLLLLVSNIILFNIFLKLSSSVAKSLKIYLILSSLSNVYFSDYYGEWSDSKFTNDIVVAYFISLMTSPRMDFRFSISFSLISYLLKMKLWHYNFSLAFELRLISSKL